MMKADFWLLLTLGLALLFAALEVYHATPG